MQERQAHKHITVNESLALLDILVQLSVESKNLTAPPSELIEGTAYIIASSASGTWENKAGQIAVVQNGAWVFVEPKAGFSAWNKTDNLHYTYYNDEWRTT